MAIYPDAPSTNWSTAAETTVDPRIVYPFRELGDTSGYVVERDFVQAQSSYSGPMALDTADGTFTSAYLIEETSPTPIDAGLVQFTRRFATVPSSFTSYIFETYTFPGYYPNYDTGGGSFRDPLPKVVPISVANSFTKSATPPTGVTIPSQKFDVTRFGSYVDYVDGSSSPTVSSYLADVSASNDLVVRDPQVVRAYGVGNIWRTMGFTTPAQ